MSCEDYKKKHGELLELLAPKNSQDTPEAIKIWQNLYKRWHANQYNKENHIGYGFRFWWLTSELDRVVDARATPRYMHLKVSDKACISAKLKRETASLVKTLQNLELDGSLIHYKTKNFGAWHIHEDARDRDKEWFDKNGSEKILLSTIIKFAGERAFDKLNEAEYLGKQGKNALAVTFLRRLMTAHSDTYAYGTPLYGVAATFTNLLYDTSYDESSARRLLG